jgi:hypothetical protein
MRRYLLGALGCSTVIIVVGTACSLAPWQPRPGGAPREAPPPALLGPGQPPAAPPAADTSSAPAVPPAEDPTLPPAAPAPPAPAAETAAEPETLSEAQYKAAVLPLFRRLRQNGLDSVGLPPIASCREVSEPRRRLVGLRAELDDIERELNALAYPASVQRAHSDLGHALHTQRAAHDLQLEALDQCAHPSALADRLQRATSALLEARRYWEEARRRLDLAP